jgi:nitrate reductase cytochrome c-type subunit
VSQRRPLGFVVLNLESMRKPMKLLTLLVVALACSTTVLAQEAAAETSEVSSVPEDAYDSSQQIEAADLPHKEDQSEHVNSEEALHAVDEEIGTLLEQ